MRQKTSEVANLKSAPGGRPPSYAAGTTSTSSSTNN